MVQQLSFLTVLSALSELSNEVYFTTVYSVTSQSFEIFYLYTVTNIYMYCKEGQTLAKMSNFTQHLHEYFCVFSPNSKAESLFSHSFFDLSKTPT